MFSKISSPQRNLRINLDKNELIPVGSVENAEELVAAIGCKVGSLPTTYLDYH